MDVEHSPTVEPPAGDRRRESPLDECVDEVGALLAMDDAGEAAVLALDKDSGVKDHVDEEPRQKLSFSKPITRPKRSFITTTSSPVSSDTANPTPYTWR